LEDKMKTLIAILALTLLILPMLAGISRMRLPRRRDDGEGKP
jgi:hypothetical protein